MFSFKLITTVFFEIILIASLSFAAHTDASPGTSSLGFRNSSIEEYPFLVSIEFRTYTTHSSNYNFACIGSILSPEFVIVPAICVRRRYKNEIKVRAGSSFRHVNGSEHGVQKIIPHPDRGNNIALLRLKNPIELDGKTKQAALMFDSEDDKIDFNKTLPVTAGWGRTDGKLRTIPMKFFDTANCTKIYDKPIEYRAWGYGLRRGQLCFLAVLKADGYDGGSLVVDGKLAGIGSRWGPDLVLPKVFTMISYHLG